MNIDAGNLSYEITEEDLRLAFEQFVCYWAKKGLSSKQSIKSRLIKSGRFLSEGTIHLSKWHPPVCNVEKF